MSAAVAGQGGDGAVEVDRVPEHDGCGEKVQPAGAVALLLEGTVADFAEPVEEHSPGEGVPGFALVQAGGDFAAQAGVLEPVQGPEGPLPISPSSRSARASPFWRG